MIRMLIMIILLSSCFSSLTMAKETTKQIKKPPKQSTALSHLQPLRSVQTDGFDFPDQPELKMDAILNYSSIWYTEINHVVHSYVFLPDQYAKTYKKGSDVFFLFFGELSSWSPLLFEAETEQALAYRLPPLMWQKGLLQKQFPHPLAKEMTIEHLKTQRWFSGSGKIDPILKR